MGADNCINLNSGVDGGIVKVIIKMLMIVKCI